MPSVQSPTNLTMPKKPACDSCHKKKVSCDGARPRCEWCTHRDLACKYDRLRGKSAAALCGQDSSVNVNKRVSKRQKTTQDGRKLVKTIPSPAQQPSPSEEEAQSSAAGAKSGHDCIFYGGLQFAGADLGNISADCGAPIFPEGGRRWIQNQTGTKDIFPTKYDIPTSPPSLFRPNASSVILDLEEMIPYHELQSWLNEFHASPLSLVFPVISRDLIWQTARTAYHPAEPTKTTNICARACVLAFALMLSQLDPGQSWNLRPHDVALYADAVEQTLLFVLADPTLDGLQTCLMMTIYRQLSGSFRSATMLHSLACRTVLALGGHQMKSEPDTIETLHCRQLFWLCYFFDKDFALRAGQVPALSDEELDLVLPRDYNFFALPRDETDISSSVPLYFSDLRLTKLKSKVCSVLWSKAATTKTNAQIIADIVTLDAEVEDWRLSVPEGYRPQLSTVSKAIQTDMSKSAKMLIICSHLEYFFLIAAIHRASGQSRKWRDGGPLEMGALKSSMQVTIEASRSTLQLLKAGLWDLHKESFWLFSFYPIWAAMTIFCYILYDPAAATTRADLDLLEVASRLMRFLPPSGLDATQESYLKSLNAFLDELPRLSNLAIAKAKATRDDGRADSDADVVMA